MIKKILIVFLLTVPGLIISIIAWLYASFSLCGISGCGGGGFGVSTDPIGVQVSLILSGVAASLALFIYAAIKKNQNWLLVALILLALMPIIGSLVIGSNFYGYPQ